MTDPVSDLAEIPQNVLTDDVNNQFAELDRIPVRPIVTSEGRDSILAFFDSELLGRSMVESGWTVAEEIRQLVSIASDNDEDKRIRMAAMEMLRKRMVDALKLSGGLIKVTGRAERESGGDRQTIIEEHIRLLDSGRRFLQKIEEGEPNGQVNQGNPSGIGQPTATAAE